MKRVLLILLVLCLLFLSGCHKVLMSGTVVAKTHIPQSRAYRPLMMVIGKHVQFFPRWVTVQEKWIVTVNSEDYNDDWEVTEEYYKTVNIGDYVDRRK